MAYADGFIDGNFVYNKSKSRFERIPVTPRGEIYMHQIADEIIKKYNLVSGMITPFSNLLIIDVYD